MSRTPKPVISVGTCASPPLCCPSQIDVDPGNVARHEAMQKARRENVVALAVSGVHCMTSAIDALQVAVEVLVHRKRPHALAARDAGSREWLRASGRFVNAPLIPLGQCVDAGAGERREVDDQLRALAAASASVSASTMRPSASLCDDLDGHAVRGADTTSCGRKRVGADLGSR